MNYLESPFDDYDQYDKLESLGYVNKSEYEFLEGAKDMLTGVIEDVYLTGDVANLEFHLENLAAYFGLILPDNLPVLKKSD